MYGVVCAAIERPCGRRGVVFGLLKDGQLRGVGGAELAIVVCYCADHIVFFHQPEAVLKHGFAL